MGCFRACLRQLKTLKVEQQPIISTYRLQLIGDDIFEPNGGKLSASLWEEQIRGFL